MLGFRGGAAIAALAACWLAAPAAAEESRNGGKLLLTGGVSSIEGAAGGGLATWALIAGNETEAGYGAKAHLTYVPLPDFTLVSYGAAAGIRDRLELSYAHQRFATGQTGAALGLGRGFTFHQDIIGAKLRVIGSAVYDQDRLTPQISIGVQYKRADRGAIIRAVGGKRSRGTDFYVAATKVMLAQSAVVNATVRFTKANQTGLLGFGGDRHDRYRPQFEGSVGRLVTRHLLVGVEYRTKPDNLGFTRENDAYDMFVAWMPARHLALTAAYVDLGEIATFDRQRGAYLSVQTSF